MPKRHRLWRRAEFQCLRRHGRRYVHPLAVLIVCRAPLVEGEQGAHSRFAFSASRRIGNAVVRNRAKRLLREATRRHLAAVHTGMLCQFVARRHTASASFAEVEEAVVDLFRRARLLNETETI